MMDIARIGRSYSAAFHLWYYTGDMSLILERLRDAEPLSKDDSILLAAIISGEWKRRKSVPRPLDIAANFRVQRLKARFARELKRKRVRGDPYKQALDAIAPKYQLSADGLDKRLRKKKYVGNFDVCINEMQKILAKRR